MDKPTKFAIYGAWIVALTATTGSLFFSEVLHLPPCMLCWYQRICMYPLVLLLATGIVRRDRNVAIYALPFAIIGLLISIYHNLLYYKILPESVAPCINGVSCTTKQIELLGFVTIPLLALVGFVIITICLIAAARYNYTSTRSLPTV